MKLSNEVTRNGLERKLYTFQLMVLQCIPFYVC